MEHPPIEIYNSPTTADIWRMKEECHQYFANCFIRFKRGEQFYPHGFARIDYASTARELVRTLHILGSGDIISQRQSYLLRLHFKWHHECVAVWDADWSKRYHIFNFWQFLQPFHVYPVKGILVRRELGKKCRYAILDNNRVEFMDTAYFLRQPRTDYQEQALPNKLCRADWQLVLNREVTEYYNTLETTSTAPTSSVILDFPVTTK